MALMEQCFTNPCNSKAIDSPNKITLAIRLHDMLQWAKSWFMTTKVEYTGLNYRTMWNWVRFQQSCG